MFQADTEPIWWSWVRAIAAEIVRQTPFRAQRCLNFLGILTTCPRGPVPLPDSPTEQRRRSRSELRCWPTADLTIEKIANSVHATSILEESRRRARSELRGWSSSNSSDDDILSHNNKVRILINSNKSNRTNGILMQTRAWGCSESSEGSDDSLTWGTVPQCTTIVDSVDCVDAAITIPEPTTREQRMQRYKEARRRENEVRRRQVMEEDARRRKASKAAEENNNDIIQRCTKIREKLFTNDSDVSIIRPVRSPNKEPSAINRLMTLSKNENAMIPTVKRSPQIIKKPLNDVQNTVRFQEDTRHTLDDNRNNNLNNLKNIQLNNNIINGSKKPGILRTTESSERRSRARERRSGQGRERHTLAPVPMIVSKNSMNETSLKSTDSLKQRLHSVPLKTSPTTKLPEISTDCIDTSSRSALMAATTTTTVTSSLIIRHEAPHEEEVAKLLERCQRVDHYVPVREKLTLFESLSRMGGRLARSTEDLGRSGSHPTPKGKQRARSLHDLNRGGAKSLPVREMCRFFENEKQGHTVDLKKVTTKLRFSDGRSTNDGCRKESSPKNPNAPCIKTSNRRKHYAK